MKKFFEEPIVEVEKFAIEPIMVVDDNYESGNWTEDMELDM